MKWVQTRGERVAVSNARSLPVPLEMDRERVLRVSGTRVTLDTVIASFDRGATPGEIASQYPGESGKRAAFPTPWSP